MNKQDVARFIQLAKSTVSRHSPEILTGIGIAGMVTTTVLAVKATPKALRLIEQAKKDERKDELTPVETIKATWKCYIPAAITGVVSTACLVGASSVSTRRNAALATAYKLSETAIAEYREKVVEAVGEKKEQAIRDKVNDERVAKKSSASREVIITDNGNTLFMDAFSGRLFRSDISTVKNAINEINAILNRDWYASLNDLYDSLGIEDTDMGRELGWNMDGGLIELYTSAHLTQDHQPCIAIEISPAPIYNFSSFIR